jgi:hypothetical protein
MHLVIEGFVVVFVFTEALWVEIERVLPREPVSPEGGPPRLPQRKVVAGILHVLRRRG